MHDSPFACSALPRRAERSVLYVTPPLAGCLLIGLTLLAHRPAGACDHHQHQRVDVIGTCRGQFVLLAADEQFDRWCPAHRKGAGTGESYLRYELRFATLAGQWLPRRIPVERFVSGKALYPNDLPDRARKKGLALAAKLPGFVAVPAPTEQKCTKTACGKAVVYEENHKPPRLVLTGPAGPWRWTAEFEPTTPAGEALMRMFPGKTEFIDPDHFRRGGNWLLESLRRYKIGASELLVLVVNLEVPILPSGVSGPFNILLPAPPGPASRSAPAPSRPTPTRL